MRRPYRVRAALPAFLLCLAGLPGLSIAQTGSTVYVPIGQPCKVGDTRETLAYSIPALGTVEWLAYGDDLSDQGGGSCPNPRPGKRPLAVAITINAVAKYADGDGNLAAYPADGEPGLATVLYVVGQNNGNTTILTLCNDGVCDGKFKITSRADTPVSAIVQGYFYKTADREVTVDDEGGDYSSITAALGDLDSWCEAPNGLNRCRVKVGAGLFFESGIDIPSFVEVEGAGIGTTTITASAEGAIFNFHGVTSAGLSNLSIFNNGGPSTADSTGGISLVPPPGVANAAILISDVAVSVFNGAIENFAVFVDDPNTAGNGFIIQDSFLVASGPTSAGMAIGDNSSNWSLTGTTLVGGTAAIGGEDITLSGNISGNTFNGGENDLYLPGVTATIRHSHLVNDTKELTGGSVACLFVSAQDYQLTPNCGTPAPP